MKLRTFLTNGIYIIALTAVGFFVTACASDLFVDPAGTCLTCTYEATANQAEQVIMACADGDGNLTVTENGSSTTSANTIADFRLPHEASGATCR